MKELPLNPTIVLNLTEQGTNSDGNTIIFRIGVFLRKRESKIDNKEIIEVDFMPDDVWRNQPDAFSKDKRFWKFKETTITIKVTKAGYMEFNKGAFSDERSFIILTSNEYEGNLMCKNWLQKLAMESERKELIIDSLKTELDLIKGQLSLKETPAELLEKTVMQQVKIIGGLNQAKTGFLPSPRTKEEKEDEEE